MKDEDKTKVELIKELKFLREELKKGVFKNFIKHKLLVEQDLNESEEKYRNLIESANESIILVDLQGNLLTLNSRAVSYLGRLAENYTGKTLWDIFPQKVAEERFAELQKVIQLGEPIIKESYIPFKGKTLCFLNSMQPIKNRSGDIYSVLILASDITEQKQAEEKLKDSEEYLKILFDYAPDAYYVNDLKGNFIDGNKAAERLTGYKRKELIGKSFLKLKLLSLTATPKAAKLLVKNLRGQPTGPDEFVLNRKDNSKVTVEISTYPVKIKGRTLVLGIARDITERKQAEERIKHLDLVLRAIRNVNQLIVTEKDRERLLKGTCDSLIKTRGYYHSRIVLLDEEDKIDTYTEAGLGKDFLPLVKLLKKGKLAPCGQIALKQEGVVIIKDPASACPDCPLVQACSARGSVMTARLEHGGMIYGVMSVSIPVHFITDKEEHALLKEVARDIALGLHSIEIGEKLDKQTHDLQQNYQKTKRAMDATIETMSKIVEAKDPYTAGHQQRVSQLAAAIAKELNLSQDKIEGIRIASLIHDIGKIGLPTEILSKPTKLSDIEFSLIKEHPQIGYDILKSIDFSYPVANIILQHHERLNGSGYPNHLKGDQILLEACILGVADVVEAMSSHRPYRPALGIDKALVEISQNKDTLYDPEVVDACLKLFKEKGFEFE